MALLEVDNLHVYYGQIHALKGISLRVEQGEIAALIGANGAGKSTTLRTISGLLRPRQGRITLSGNDLSVLPAHEIVAKGVVQVPEGRRIFGRLNVHENLMMGAYARTDPGAIEGHGACVGPFPSAARTPHTVGRNTFRREQQMLAIGRRLCPSQGSSAG